MIPSTVQFITGMKLRELRRQREQFRDSYRRLRREVEAAPDPIHRLRRLYHGLQGLKFAGQPLLVPMQLIGEQRLQDSSLDGRNA